MSHAVLGCQNVLREGSSVCRAYRGLGRCALYPGLRPGPTRMPPLRGSWVVVGPVPRPTPGPIGMSPLRGSWVVVVGGSVVCLLPGFVAEASGTGHTTHETDYEEADMNENRYSRREFVGAGLTAGAGLTTGLLIPRLALASTAPVAKTTAGKVRGMTVDGVHVFKGVPYGASTAGTNRFMPPQAPVPWKEERDAVAYGLSAPQSDPNVSRPPAATSALIGELSDKPEGEDCLVLNVWTRGLADGGKRPVMFWIHGGGFQAGSGSSQGYDGTNLCKRGDVVVVTINHRLNALGFAFFGDLGGEEFANSGNVGMLDIVQALRWVRDNIENFGGDPSRVMIFGESGGGRKVGTLLAMPAAKGLFHRAAIQSGPTIRVVTREDATFATQALLDELQMARGDVRKLRDVPLEKLMPAYFAASRKHRFNHAVTGFAPVVDGRILPQHPFHPSASAVVPEVPLIVGTNRTEMTLQLVGDAAAFSLDEVGLKSRANELFGDKTESMISVYRQSVPGATPSELFFLMISDYRYCAPIMKIAERRAALGKAPVYAYYFAWETPVQGGRLKSPHALEISFAFDNTELSKRFTGGGARPAALADKMSDAWIAFARTGDPNTSKLTRWSAYSNATRATMVFNDTSAIVNDPLGERRKAIQAVLNLD
jgi:para-nitrobenzyl esterase